MQIDLTAGRVVNPNPDTSAAEDPLLLVVGRYWHV